METALSRGAPGSVQKVSVKEGGVAAVILTLSNPGALRASWRVVAKPFFVIVDPDEGELISGSEEDIFITLTGTSLDSFTPGTVLDALLFEWTTPDVAESGAKPVSQLLEVEFQAAPRAVNEVVATLATLGALLGGSLFIFFLYASRTSTPARVLFSRMSAVSLGLILEATDLVTDVVAARNIRRGADVVAREFFWPFVIITAVSFLLAAVGVGRLALRWYSNRRRELRGVEDSKTVIVAVALDEEKRLPVAELNRLDGRTLWMILASLVLEDLLLISLSMYLVLILNVRDPFLVVSALINAVLAGIKLAHMPMLEHVTSTAVAHG